MIQVEDMSHCLVWTRPNSRDGDGNYAIYRIEMPRLKLSFVPQQVGTSVKLQCREQSGWFLSMYAALNEDGSVPVDRPGMARLHSLLRGIPNSLVLEDKSKQLQVLVTSHKQVKCALLDCYKAANAA